MVRVVVSSLEVVRRMEMRSRVIVVVARDIDRPAEAAVVVAAVAAAAAAAAADAAAPGAAEVAAGIARVREPV